jgi:phage terminase large subunit GpA-like protein
VTAIDSGFAAERVVAFVAVQRRKSRSIFPVKGVAGFGKAHLREGGKLKGHMRVTLVGVDEVKLIVAKRLAADEVGPNYIHLPSHLPSEYFDQLAAERLMQQADRHGFAKYAWTKIARNNEAFDALVYALAIAGKLNLTNINRPQPPRKSLAEIGAALNRRAA